MLTLDWKNRMAARVALEIERCARDPDSLEGLAYKAEWDKRGSDALKHVVAVERDRYRMAWGDVGFITRSVSL